MEEKTELMQSCEDLDCSTCDYALECFPPCKEETLLFRRSLKIKAVQRLMREIKEIDKELAEMMSKKEVEKNEKV